MVRTLVDAAGPKMERAVEHFAEELKKGAAVHTGWSLSFPVWEISISDPRARKRICSGSMELSGSPAPNCIVEVPAGTEIKRLPSK